MCEIDWSDCSTIDANPAILGRCGDEGTNVADVSIISDLLFQGKTVDVGLRWLSGMKIVQSFQFEEGSRSAV